MKQITEYTDIELKALAFDQIQLRDQAVQNLNIIHQEMKRRMEEAKTTDEAKVAKKK